MTGDPSLLGDRVGTLSADAARSVRLAKNDTGSWSVQVERGSADAAMLLTNRWVKFKLDASYVFSGRIGPWDQDTISQEEESGELLTVSGPGALATLRDAIVFPHSSTGRLARDTRFFNFASPDYDHSGWSAALQLYRQGDAATSLYGVDTPADWPDPNAYWIWGTALNLSAVPPHALGDCYFWKSVTLAAEGDRALFITADDGYELWIDGVMLAAQTEAFIFRQTFRIDQFLDAGTHEIAIRGTNISRPSSPATNAAAVIFSMYKTDGGELLTLDVHSDNTWKVKAYPARPPGFTAGKILRILREEPDARGAVQPWGDTFSDTNDSNGIVWADEIDVSFRYEDTLADVLAKLAETYIDFGADYESISLDAVNKGGYRSTSGVSLFEGVHLAGLRHTGDPSRTTDLLMRNAEGTVLEVSSGTGGTGTQPRVEAFLDAGTAPSEAAAEDMAAGVFADVGARQVRVTAGVERVAGSVPTVNFDVGQLVTMPNRDGNGAQTEIVAISITEEPPQSDGEELGTVVFTVEGIQNG